MKKVWMNPIIEELVISDTACGGNNYPPNGCDDNFFDYPSGWDCSSHQSNSWNSWNGWNNWNPWRKRQ